MIYDVSAIATLARSCAPEIATEAVVPLVLTESGGNALAINVNRGPRLHADSIASGAALVRRYVATGYTVDVGLAQINSANLARLGVTAEHAFDPCTNLRLASIILQQGYKRATRSYAGLEAISATYSLYNTGTLTRGLRNGYVGRIWAAAATLESAGAPSRPTNDERGGEKAVRPEAPPETRDEWVFGQLASSDVEVFK